MIVFFYFLKKVIGTIKVPVNNKGIIDGPWRGERNCIDPKAVDADLWIKIWEEFHQFTTKYLVEVDKKEMSNCEKFVTESNGKGRRIGDRRCDGG